MDAMRALLACPACSGPLSIDWRCGACRLAFDAAGGIPNLRLSSDARTEAVRRFYDAAPFPAYPARDDVYAFRARADRSRFARLLDRTIPADARIAEIGCGTGQMSLYLAHSDRIVIAADLARRSLELAAEAAARYRVGAVQFVETDLRRPGLRPASFDVVYSSGVLHHTPRPRESFAALVRLLRPGGVILVGVYNRIARLPTRLRRAVARLTRFRVVPFDPVLRDRRHDAARRDAWLRDQYRHPEEHSHSVREIGTWFDENGVEWLRTYPSVMFDDEPDDLFTAADDNWRAEAWLAQVGWMWTLGREGGLFVAIGRRARTA